MVEIHLKKTWTSRYLKGFLFLVSFESYHLISIPGSHGFSTSSVGMAGSSNEARHLDMDQSPP